MSLYSICIVPIPVDKDTYSGYGYEYTQVHAQYPYITMSLDAYVPYNRTTVKGVYVNESSILL